MKNAVLILVKDGLEALENPAYFGPLNELITKALARDPSPEAMCTPSVVDEIKDFLHASQTEFNADHLLVLETLFFNLYCPRNQLNYQAYLKKTSGERLEFIREKITAHHQTHPKFQFVSDLHLEFYATGDPIDSLPVLAPYLILLGDIGNPFEANYQQFIADQARHFEQVYVVAGNHEYYRNAVPTTDKKITNICKKFSNVHYLNHNAIDVPDTSLRLLGCTLWSHTPTEYKTYIRFMMNDYRHISTDKAKTKRLSVEETNAWHAQSVQWLESEIERAKDAGKEVMICTHHAPSITDAVSPEELAQGPSHAAMCGTDLSRLFKTPVKAWLFGHSHHNCDFFSPHKVRIVSNQKGYINEETGYDPKKTLE